MQIDSAEGLRLVTKRFHCRQHADMRNHFDTLVCNLARTFVAAASVPAHPAVSLAFSKLTPNKKGLCRDKESELRCGR